MKKTYITPLVKSTTIDMEESILLVTSPDPLDLNTDKEITDENLFLAPKSNQWNKEKGLWSIDDAF